MQPITIAVLVRAVSKLWKPNEIVEGDDIKVWASENDILLGKGSGRHNGYFERADHGEGGNDLQKFKRGPAQNSPVGWCPKKNREAVLKAQAPKGWRMLKYNLSTRRWVW